MPKNKQEVYKRKHLARRSKKKKKKKTKTKTKTTKKKNKITKYYILNPSC